MLSIRQSQIFCEPQLKQVTNSGSSHLQTFGHLQSGQSDVPPSSWHAQIFLHTHAIQGPIFLGRNKGCFCPFREGLNTNPLMLVCALPA
ncbi:hypothetical protein PENSUB_4922 [Penicillium subrubescens]|uniref:Uncharacterized protein n=1 Tax=Penicillium subrubescens TaxID=1316194 RepID=A0A1Q5UB09_9EURO|nr:hypothetical protein PENSUB_4922 [Penicillium subrubescens]